MFFLGILAFILFFLSDMNDVWFHSRLLKPTYFLGVALLTFAVIMLSVKNAEPSSLVVRISFGTLGAVFFFLLVYSLFFAIPFGSSYTKPGSRRSVCTQGVYALCRHPGVLWFTGLCFCLSAAFGFPLYAATVYSLLNGLLVVFEDGVVFPKVLSGYCDYRRTTPFLLPNRSSIATCVAYYKGRYL